MKSHLPLLLTTIALMLPCSVLRAQAPDAKEPDELNRLRQAYLQRRADALKPVSSWYQTQLEDLERKLKQTKDPEGALLVRRELDALRESSAQDGEGELKKALLATKWSWTGKPGDKGVAMTFKEDGTVSHIGMHGTWQLAGPRDVIILVSDGARITLHFDATMQSYAQVGGPLHGRPWR